MKIFDPTKWEEAPSQKRKASLSSNGQPTDAERVKDCIFELKSRGVDITKTYADWIKLGFAFTTLGVEGRSLFQELSSIHPDYDNNVCDKKFDELSKSAIGIVGLGTFFKYCSDQGVRYADSKEILTVTTSSNSTTKLQSAVVSNGTTLLDILLADQAKLKERTKKQIEFVQPIIKYGDYDLFYPRSTNVIQGKMGAHKSRYAGDVASLLLSKELKPCIAGLTRTALYNRPTVEYVDTERNLTDQLPHAMQKIILRAGYTLVNPPENFMYTSMINIPRNDRLQAIKDYIEHVRAKVTNHLVFFIDVLTDVQGDFNSIEQTYTLLDFLNVLINQYEITFFLVVHENPFNDKARGHAGTEGGNKASSLVSVTKEKDTNLIKVDPLKVRNGPNDWDYYLKWSDQEQGLVEATGEEVAISKNNKSGLKVPLSELLQLTAKVLHSADPMSKSDLIAGIRQDLLSIGQDVSEETIKTRFKGINSKTTIQYDRSTYRIVIKEIGKHKMFSLQEIKRNDNTGNR